MASNVPVVIARGIAAHGSKLELNRHARPISSPNSPPRHHASLFRGQVSIDAARAFFEVMGHEHEVSLAVALRFDETNDLGKHGAAELQRCLDEYREYANARITL